MRKYNFYPVILLICAMSACSGNTPVDEVPQTERLAGEQPRSQEAGKRPASERADSATLFEAAAALYGKGRIENAGFLFYVAQLRGRIDWDAYQPVGTGGDSPGVLLSALREQLGWRINPAVMSDRDVFARVVGRVSMWSPVFDPSYDPGWEYKSAPSKVEFDKLATEVKTLWLGQMRDFGKLLQDDEYYDLFRKVQAYNLSGVEGLPPAVAGRGLAETIGDEEYAAAMKRLEEIEAERGVKFGMFTRRDPDTGYRTHYEIAESDVTFDNRKIANADTSTFHVFPQVEFARDTAHVYVRGWLIPEADPETFQVIKGPYSRDATRFFCGNIAMKVSNVDAFEVVYWEGMWEETFDRDSFLFDYGDAFKDVEVGLEHPAVVGDAWARDGEFYYCGPARVEGADYATFEICQEHSPREEYYSAKDKHRKYFKSFPEEQLPDRRQK